MIPDILVVLVMVGNMGVLATCYRGAAARLWA